MFESLFPADDIWDKFDIPPVSLYSDLLSSDVMMEPPQVVPNCANSVIGGRHDCMWAGTCSNGQHQRWCCEPEPEPIVAVTVTVCPIKANRSLLRTTRVRARSSSPRPETPSESEEDESPVCNGVCGDNEDLSVAVSVSEVTGQISRTTCEIKSEVKSLSPPPSPTPAPAYYSDHSYHLSKTSVTLDSLGVQTPSDSAGKKGIWGWDSWKKSPSLENPEPYYPDSPESCEYEESYLTRASTRSRITPKFFDSSVYLARKRRRDRKGQNVSKEEEIDVVSIGDREKLTTLPTNPSARDRQQLQRTVASAIHHRQSRSRKRPASTEEKRQHKRRRTHEDGEDSSDKRNQHNNMERLRRIDLRDAIAALRVLVPAVEKNERAAKVNILKEAAAYCHSLAEQDDALSRMREKLSRQQRELTARVKELRVMNAKMRGNVEKSPRKKRMGSRKHSVHEDFRERQFQFG